MSDPTTPAPQRGRCVECHYSYRLTKKGEIGRHYIYYGYEAVPCKGSGRKPLGADHDEQCGDPAEKS